MPPSRPPTTPRTPPPRHHVDPPPDGIPRDSSPLTSQVSTLSSLSPVPSVHSPLACQQPSPARSARSTRETVHQPRPPAKTPLGAGASPRHAQTRPGVPVDQGSRPCADSPGADRVVEGRRCKVARAERLVSGMEGDEDEDEDEDEDGDQKDVAETLIADRKPPIHHPLPAHARKRKRQEIHDEMRRLDAERQRLAASLRALDDADTDASSDDNDDNHPTRTSTQPTPLTTSPATAARKARAHATHLARIALAAARTAATERTRAAAVVARRAERDRVMAVASAEEAERKARVAGTAVLRGGKEEEEEGAGGGTFERGRADSVRCGESTSAPSRHVQGSTMQERQELPRPASPISTSHPRVKRSPEFMTSSDQAQNPSYPAIEHQLRTPPNPTTMSRVSASQPAPARPSSSQTTGPPVAQHRLGVPVRPDRRPAVVNTLHEYSLADAPETSALLAEIEALSRSVTSGGSAVGLFAHLDGRCGYSNASAGPSAFPLSSSAPPAGPSRHHLANIGTGRRTDKGKGKVPSPVKAKPSIPADKRPAMFRKKAPRAVLERAERVRSQRMFMVHQSRHPQHLCATMRILGSTGNVYTVEFGARPTCDCPDFAKGNHCKHIIFVALKVLRMPEDGSLWYQKGYTQAELCEIFDSAPPNGFDSVTAPANVQQVLRQHLGLESAPAAGTSASVAGTGNADRGGQGKRTPNDGDECPICSDEMQVDGRGANELVYDLGAGGCGRALHKQCFQMWAVQERKKGKQPTCVYCRHPWSSDATGGSAAGGCLQTADGYLNMAELAGMSRYRDTSSYYRGPRRGKGRWQPYGYDDEGFW